MTRHFDDLRRIVREEMARLRMPELGQVTDIYPHEAEGDADNYGCDIALRTSGLVLRRVPIMSSRNGSVSVPDVGDLVVVQYLGGDANAPILIGTVYNDEDRPPVSAPGEARLRLPPAASEGEGIDLHLASADPASARLHIGSALSVTLQDDDPVVEIDVGGGAARLSIDSDGTVSLTAQGDLTLEGNQITIKGAAITAEAQGEIKMKGAVINLN